MPFIREKLIFIYIYIKESPACYSRVINYILYNFIYKYNLQEILTYKIRYNLFIKFFIYKILL